MNDVHPWLVRASGVIEIHNRNAARAQTKHTPGDSGSPEVKDSHIGQVRETAFEFFVSVLTEPVCEGSGTIRIDQLGGNLA
jgi:hypothetical protein